MKKIIFPVLLSIPSAFIAMPAYLVLEYVETENLIFIIPFMFIVMFFINIPILIAWIHDKKHKGWITAMSLLSFIPFGTLLYFVALVCSICSPRNNCGKGKQILYAFIARCEETLSQTPDKSDMDFILGIKKIIIKQFNSDEFCSLTYEKLVNRHGSVEIATYSLIIDIIEDIKNKLANGKTKYTALKIEKMAKDCISEYKKSQRTLKQEQLQQTKDIQNTNNALELVGEVFGVTKPSPKQTRTWIDDDDD